MARDCRWARRYLAPAPDWRHKVDLGVPTEWLGQVAVVEDGAVDGHCDVGTQGVVLDDAPDEFGALLFDRAEDGAERRACDLEPIAVAGEGPQRGGDVEHRHDASPLRFGVRERFEDRLW